MSNSKTQGDIVIKLLKSKWPNAKCELNSINNYTFLIAVLLSAQTTDKAVNEVTRFLFKILKSPKDALKLGTDGIVQYIHTLGLYNIKARNIFNLSNILIEKHNSQVPLERCKLELLPGIGRKSANVILNQLANQPYIAVDTHVKRVSLRLNLTQNNNIQQIENDLYDILSSENYMNASNLLIMHGRYTCKAKNPRCYDCVVSPLCKYKKSSKI